MSRITHVYRAREGYPWMAFNDAGGFVCHSFERVKTLLALQGDTLPDWFVEPGTMQTPIPLPAPTVYHVAIYSPLMFSDPIQSRASADGLHGLLVRPGYADPLWRGTLTVTPDGELVAVKNTEATP